MIQGTKSRQQSTAQPLLILTLSCFLHCELTSDIQKVLRQRMFWKFIFVLNLFSTLYTIYILDFTLLYLFFSCFIFLILTSSNSSNTNPPFFFNDLFCSSHLSNNILLIQCQNLLKVYCLNNVYCEYLYAYFNVNPSKKMETTNICH